MKTIERIKKIAGNWWAKTAALAVTALLARHIPRMDRRGHRMFQRTVQVPLPDSLFPRGARHHPLYPEFSGLLRSDKVEHSGFYIYSYIRSCPDEDGFFFIAMSVAQTKGKDRNGRRRYRQSEELQGKVGVCFLSDGKVGPQAVSEKIILAQRAAVFFPKTLPFRKHPPPGPRSSTGCQSPSIHN